ncbi:MAG: hypothetical protein GXO63_00505, partial [Candidatus Micrarchaeota archaeon]|nr:hypothetical protein [Candidatus Micrarchaeota archaeon]
MRCPECGSDRISARRMEMICLECGLVVDERLFL